MILFRRVQFWLLGGLVFLGAVYGRVSWSSQAALDRATSYLEQGQTRQAIYEFGTAVRNYTPFSMSVTSSVERLDSLAAQAEMDGQSELAIEALRQLRGAMNATKGFHDPFSDARKPVNERLAQLLATEQIRTGGPTLRGRTRTQLVEEHLALLNLDPAPSRLMALIVLLTFSGWIGGTFMTIRYGLDRNVRIRKRQFLLFGIVSFLCFVGWLAALHAA